MSVSVYPGRRERVACPACGRRAPVRLLGALAPLEGAVPATLVCETHDGGCGASWDALDEARRWPARGPCLCGAELTVWLDEPAHCACGALATHVGGAVMIVSTPATGIVVGEEVAT